MYFLIELLQRQASLTPHQLWILALLFFFSVALSLASIAIRLRDEKWDAMLLIQSLFLWSLTFDRILIVIRYEYLIYEEYEQYYSVWTPARHLSLLCIELPLYALGFILLSPALKKWLANRFKEWLKSA